MVRGALLKRGSRAFAAIIERRSWEMFHAGGALTLQSVSRVGGGVVGLDGVIRVTVARVFGEVKGGEAFGDRSLRPDDGHEFAERDIVP